MKEFPGKYGFSVSHTTRQPRERRAWGAMMRHFFDIAPSGPGETDGVQYHFVTLERFREEIAAGSFIEWAVYSGNHYGTTVKAVTDLAAQGKIALLDIDLQGVKSLKALPKASIDPFYIVLVPPSVDDLRRRIEGRGDTSPESMRKRLDTAVVELEHAAIPGFFDRVIVSGDREMTYQTFLEAMQASQAGAEARM